MQYHTVRRGETLAKISKKYGITIAQIRKYNRIGKKGVKQGQKLKIVSVVRKYKPAPVVEPEQKTVVAPIDTTACDTITVVPATEMPVDSVANVSDVANAFAINETPEQPQKEDKKVETKKPTPKAEPKRPRQRPPKTVYHTVRRGDNLSKIAKKYGVSVAAIKRANNMGGDNIQTGQKLKNTSEINIINHMEKNIKTPDIPAADVDPIDLPENAFIELGADEEYRPVMHPAREYPEVTPYSVTMGLVLAVIFSAAAAYLGLKVGQVFEAAIPIAIIAVGLSARLKKKNPLGQNVIIQSIGACSGVIVAGTIFTLPALYILQSTHPEITVNFLEVFLSSLFGGVLGILFFIPFRKYFVKDMHGKYPFPEATATTQVLISGQSVGKEGSGGQALLLLVASLVGGLYDYIVATFGFWSEVVTTTAYSWGQALADKFKFVFSCNTGAAVLGLGYIVGLKYAFVIFAGSVFVWWFIIPLMGTYGSEEIVAMSPQQIFGDYARMIGIGGIAMAGIIGIVKSRSIIGQAVGLAARELKRSAGSSKTGSLADRYLDETYCILHRNSPHWRIPVLLFRRNPHLVASFHCMACCYGNRIPLYYRCGQCNRYSRL